ncbi:unnamed protein product [Sphagnum compactum]
MQSVLEFFVSQSVTFTGTTITVLLATPVVIFFSPVWIPLATVAFFAVSALLGAGAFGVAAVSAVSWVYNYFRGRQPYGSDRLFLKANRVVLLAYNLGGKQISFMNKRNNLFGCMSGFADQHCHVGDCYKKALLEGSSAYKLEVQGFVCSLLSESRQMCL